MKKINAFLIVMIMLASRTVNATTTSAPLTVSVTPNAGNCSITTTNSVSFVYGGILPVNGNGAVVVNCANGINYSIGLDAGLHFDGTYRWVVDGANSSGIAYGLYQDSNHTIDWGDMGVTISDSAVSDVGIGADQTHTVYGVLTTLVGGVISVQPYSDTINVVVNY